MNLTVIGTGFVGVVTSAVFAKFGNSVIGLDVDSQKIANLTAGIVPFFEPDLKQLLTEGITHGNLTFTTDYKKAIEQAEVVMIAVGTPSQPNGNADLTAVFSVAESIAPFLQEKAIVVIKSTVPPGTNKRVAETIKKRTKVEFAMASLPEFLREGSAVSDTLNPDRIVIGANESWVIEKLLSLHKPLSGERVITIPESAQMAKYAANAYLAQRITFINQIADLCEKAGANVNEVIKAIGLDKRIGAHYWYPGLGYGGSCFPKDVKELAAYAQSIGENDSLLIKIDALNEKRIEKKFHEFDSAVQGFAGKKVAVLGLSFKPNTNDMRYAPSLKVIPLLQQHGATVSAYDPEAMGEAERFFESVEYAKSPYEAARGADVLVLLIEWDELKQLDLPQLASIMKRPAYFIDTRNQYDKHTVEQLGIEYIGIGNL